MNQHTTKKKVFKTALRPSRILAETARAIAPSDNEDLIRMYHYSKLGSALLREPSYRGCYWTESESSFISKHCGKERIKQLICELVRRDIFSQANESYFIDFKAIKSRNLERARNIQIIAA